MSSTSQLADIFTLDIGQFIKGHSVLHKGAWEAVLLGTNIRVQGH